MAETIDTGLWGNYQKQDPSKVQSTSDKRGELDKDAFLKLLIVQMRYQDPLNPMDDKEFVAQLAQFSALEQMNNLNTNASKSQAYSLIGKTIIGNMYSEASDSYETVSGRVTAVVTKGSEVFVKLGEKEVPLSKIQTVYDDYFQSGQLQGISDSVNTSQILSLVGKFIQAVTLTDKLEPTGYVEGRVDYVKFSTEKGKEGLPILVIGDKEVLAQEIISVANDDSLKLKGRALSYDKAGTLVPGTIDNIAVINKKVYLVVGGENVAIEKISDVTEALRYVGKTVSSGNVSGTASGIIIRGGKVYISVGDQELQLDALKGKS